MNTPETTPAPESQPVTPAPPKRRRLRKFLLWTAGIVVGLLLLIAFAGPPLISSIGRGVIVDTLNEKLAGKAELDRFSFSWSGAIALDGLRIRDAGSQEVLSVKTVSIQVSFWDALKERYQATVKVDEPVINARRSLDGTLNLSGLMKPTPLDASSAPPPDLTTSQPSPLPFVKADIEVLRGQLTLTEADGSKTEYTDVSAHLNVDDLNRPVHFDATLAGSGSASVNGDLTLARNGQIDIQNVNGPVRCRFDDLNLANLQAAVTGSGIDQISGTLKGDSEYQLTSMRSATGKTTLQIRNLHLAGPAVGAKPVQLATTDFTADVAMDDTGTGTANLTIALGDFFSAIVNASTKTLTADAGSAEASIKVTTDLAGLTETARSQLNIKSGHTVSGKALFHSQVSAQTRGRDFSSTASITAKIHDLTAKDDQGKPLPVDPEMSLSFKGRYDSEGPARIDDLDLTAGKVRVKGHGAADLRNRSVSDSQFMVDADLDDLSSKLSSFMELPVCFGGTVAIDSKIAGSGETSTSKTLANVMNLRLDLGDGRTIGPFNMTVDQTAQFDLRPGGTSSLSKFDLHTSFLDLSATGSVKDAGGPERNGTVTSKLRVRPDQIQECFGALLGETRIAGPEVSFETSTTFTGPALTAKGQLRSGGLTLYGPSIDPAGANTGSLHMEFAASSDGADALELSNVTLKSELATGEGSIRITRLLEEDMNATGKFAFQGAIEPLIALARAFVPDLKEARASGLWNFTTQIETDSGITRIVPALDIRGLNLEGVHAQGRPVSIRNADLAFDSRVAVRTAGEGTLDLEACTFAAPGLSCSITGTAVGFLAKEPRPSGGFQISADVNPDEVTSRLSAFLSGYALSGSSLAAKTDLRFAHEQVLAKGTLTAPNLLIRLPGEPLRAVSQSDLITAFDVEAVLTPGAETIKITECRFSSSTASATLAGSVQGFSKPTADLTLTADAELSRVMKDLGSLLPSPSPNLQGKAEVRFVVKGDAGTINASGGATVSDFQLTAEGTKPGETITVSDPSVSITLDSDVATETMDLRLRSLGCASRFLKGTISGEILALKSEPQMRNLKGDLTYIPDQLGAVLQPFLPGKLSGKQEEKLTFTLNGRAKEIDILQLLRGSTGTASVGLGQFTTNGLATRGNLAIDLKDQHAKARSTLDVNAGKTLFDADADLRDAPDAKSTVTLDLQQVDANAEMSPLLSYIHPLFATVGSDLQGFIGGKIDCALNLSYNQTLPQTLLKGDWAGTPKHPINGKGHFQIAGFGIKGGALMNELVSALNEDAAAGGVELNPIDFTIRDGRLSYDRPMKMKISGQETHWSGSIGLDQTLDMTWQIPVTEKLVRKHSFLKYWLGQSISVPVRGTSTYPKLQWDDLLTDLAAKAVQKELEERVGGGLGDLTEGLGDLLGGGDEKEARKLLEQADQLYSEGRKADAAAIYRRIHSEYRKTRTYKDNKDRIKARETEQ